MGYWLGSALTDQRFQLLFLGLCVAAIFALAFAYSFFVYPSAIDDLCRVATSDGSLSDAARRAQELYNGWTGRWLISFFHALYLPNIELYGPSFSLTMVSVVLLWVAGFAIGTNIVLRQSASLKAQAAISFLLFSIFWASILLPRETLYWYSGGIDYGVAFLLLMLSLAALAALVRRPSWHRAAVTGALAFATASVHELTGLIAAAATLLTASVSLLTRRPHASGYVGAALLLALGGLTLSLAAPGNAVRADLTLGSGDYLFAIRNTLFDPSSPPHWIFDVRLIALSLLLLSWPEFRSLRFGWKLSGIPWVVVLPSVTMLAVCAAWFTTAITMGMTPFARVHAPLYGLFVIGWLATLAAVVDRFDLNAETGPGQKVVRTLACLLLGSSLITSGNFAVGLYDLRHAATDWRRSNEERLHMITVQKNRGEAEPIVAPIGRVPRLIITTDPVVLSGLNLPRDFERRLLTAWDRQRLDRCDARYWEVEQIHRSQDPDDTRRNSWRRRRTTL